VKVTSDTAKPFVIIEKPLLKKKITVREKNNHFYSVAFESCSLQMPSVQKPVKLDTSEQPSSSLNLEEDNLTYNVWQFGPIKVLIRCKIHGYISAPTATVSILVL
jgi:hypothetical protein